MKEDLLASIIITNYNYARFLRDAIDSALNQTYPNTEIVVVDDGSTDQSRAILDNYSGRVVPVLKSNGGMGSTYNAGFPVTRGEVILFLDSDDALLPTTVETAVDAFFEKGDLSKVQWPLWEVNAGMEKTGRIIPGETLDEGDLKRRTLSDGPDSYISPPTSGNAWARQFLEQVLPVPEAEFRQHADTYLNTLAPVFGPISALSTPQGFYRVHGQNDFAGKPSDEKNRRNLEVYDHRCSALNKYFKRSGVNISPNAWKTGNFNYQWMKWQDEASAQIRQMIPEGDTFILVDEDNFGDRWGGCEVVADRHALPFTEQDGEYWGPPANDQEAIRELERLHLSGATFMVFAWPAFWWLDYYSGLHQYLCSRFHRVIENDQLVVFDMR